MNALHGFNTVLHHFHISSCRKDINTERKRCDSIDRNTLMNRQNIRMEISDRLKHERQDSRLVIELNYHRNRLSLRILMKWKYIIFVFVEGTSADSYHLGGILNRCHLARVKQALGFYNFEQYLRHSFFL